MEANVKAKALTEVVVVFSLALLLIALVGLSPLGAWERQVLKYNFAEYAVMIAVPLLVIAVARRNRAAYGLSFQNLRYHLDIAATAFLPVALSFVPISFFDYKQWNGALVMAAVEIALLFALGWLLKRKSTRNETGLLAGAFLVIVWSNFTPKVSLGHAVSAFVFYILLLGFGEELLFRGFIQSRLNGAWGRPFQFFGISWGWGILMASILFGLMHVINTGSLIVGDWQPEPWWGLWTFFAGFVSGFVRQKTGSVVAPAILHGPPQAIYTAFSAA
jgi:uncharacterized protein